ncbi:hypothetical protein TNIN_62551 [Trichonephila inaurata madagascariensis]|uniref:C2H2-type domain-containing protein n=1 Tax=Trichonephila inaurata madagascariensis TaxID=2747483 RepID=A0A8X7C5D8_9ARAC|nr:hypothetical protein TNIN_62551 [Trichonephila inaurata madagascariensis]
MEDYLSKELNNVRKIDFEQNFGTSEEPPFLQTTAFENNQREFLPTEHDGCIAQCTAFRYIPSIERNFMWSQTYNASGHVTYLQGQNIFQANQPNLPTEYNYSSGANTEQREERVQEYSIDVLFDNPDAPKACEAVLGIDSTLNDNLSQTIDSMVFDTLSSDFTLLDSKFEVSVLYDKIPEKNEGSTSESKCEKSYSNNKPSGSVSITENLKSLRVRSNIFLQQKDFQSQACILNLKGTCFCDNCLKQMTTLPSLLKRKSTLSSEKHSQYGICQQNYTQMGHFSQQNPAVTMEKYFLCNTCQQMFLENDRDHHMSTHTTHTHEKCIQWDVCRKTITKDHFIRHMFIHSKEKPYWCDTCKRNLSAKRVFTAHMRAHAKGKSFPCDLCEQRFLRKRDLTRHMHRTHTEH